MADIAELGIRVDSRQVRQGSDALDDFARRGARAEVSANSLMGVVKSLGAGLGALALIVKAIDFGSAVIKAQRDFDKLNSSLITATGSIGAAGQAFAALQRFAANTPYDLQQTTKAFVQLRNLGLTPSERALMSYGNTAAAMGKDLSQMVEAVADATTGEFERLKEFGIKAKQNGDKVALTFQGTTTTIANSAEAIEGYLIRLGETKFAGGMELQAKTLDGALSGLADTWDSTLLAFAQSGFGEAAHESVLGLSGALVDLQAIIRSFNADIDEQGRKIEELSPLHEALTEIFTVSAVVATNVAYVFRAVGKDIGAFAATVLALARGDWREASNIAAMRKADAEEERQMVDAKTEKIRWAAAVVKKVRENEAEEKSRELRDDLERFGIVREATTQQTDAQKAAAKARKQAAQDAANWYKQTTQSGKDEIAVMRAELDVLGELTPAQRESIKTRAEMARLGALISPQQKKIIEGQLAEREALEQVSLERQHYVDLLQKGFAASSSDVSAAEARVAALQDEVKHYGLTEEAVLRLTLAELRRKQAAAGDDVVEQDRLFRLIAATEDQLELQTKLTKLKANTDFWTSLDDTARQTFRSIEDGGKGIWQRIKESAKNVFFDWLYQMTAKKWILNLSTSADGSGLSSLLGGSGSSGGAMGIMDLVSAGKTLYSAFSGGMAASMGGIITQMGNLFGSSAISAFGTGMGLTGAQAGAAAAAYGGTGTAVGGGLSAGASTASAVPIIGWIIAGMMANNKFFKEGWNIDGQATDITKSLLGSTLKGNPFGLLGGAMTFGINQGNTLLKKIGLSDQLASLISGSSLWTRAFGHRKPTIESQGVEGNLSASGFSGQAFANILQKGGWFRSDKRSTATAALSAEQDGAFDSTMAGIVAAVQGFGSVLGAEASAINGYNKAIKLTLTADEAKNQELIASMFSGVADELATLLVPGIAAFSAEGETASATLQRVAGNFASVNAILSAMGVTAQQAFGAVGVSTIAARERLLSLAGGLDAFAAQADYFAQNFLTEEQRMAPAIKAVREQMTALGYAGVTTTEQFTAAVMALSTSGALATESGAKAYAGLLAIAPQFKAVADYLQQIADAKAAAELEKAAAAAQAVADASKAISDAAEALMGKVNASLSGVSRAVDAERSQIEKAHAAIMEALQAGIDKASASVSRLSGLSNLLHSTLTGMTLAGQEAATRAAAQAQIQAALTIARAGGALPDADAIRDALSVASKSSMDDFGSYLEYVRDYARTASDIADLASITDGQLTVQERQLAALQDQYNLAQKQYDAEMERLDGILEKAQQEVDMLSGIAGTVLTIPQSLAQLAAAIMGAKANPIIAGNANMAQVNGLYNTLLGRDADAEGMGYWTSKLESGWQISDIIAGIKNSAEYQGQVPKFGNGGDHAGGWRIVGDRGVEMEYTGPSHIVSNGATSDLFGGMEERIASLENTLAVGLARLIDETKRGADAAEEVADNTSDEEAFA